ncbi:MAG: immune inhibitor A [Anaerolineae bacterium]
MIARRAWAWGAAALLLVLPVMAQETPSSDAFPTVAALEEASLPPRDRVDLAIRLLGAPPLEATPTSALPRKVGERAGFTVTNSDSNETFTVTARLAAVGEHIYMWVDEAADVPGTLIADLTRGFDERIYPQVRDLWGSEDKPGVDGDARIYALFASGVGPTAAAYFASDNTVPPAYAPNSNGHEMFIFNADVLTGYDAFSIESIMSHEFQHMIRDNLQPNEELWINEGFSEFTQLYLFDENMNWVPDFLAFPDTQLNAWNENSALRGYNYGASLAFVTYFFERFGPEGLRILSEDSSPRALDGVARTLEALGGPPLDEFFADWVMANGLFDARYDQKQYGYTLLPDWIEPAASVQLHDPPSLLEGTTHQYAANYALLPNVTGYDAFCLTLKAPSEVPLVPLDEHDGRFWYSNRADQSDLSLTHAFDLRGIDSAELRFDLWYWLEEAWDFAYVMVSTDGGQTWTPQTTSHTTDWNPHGTAFGPGYNGQSDGWVEEVIPLDAYAGQEILVRFEVITDDGVNQPGVAVDHIRLDAVDYSSDFEVDAGGWTADGWVLTDNRLPQRAWLQAAQRAQDNTVLGLDRWQWAPDLGESTSSWTLELEPDAQNVLLAVSPYAPVTSETMPYALEVRAGACP